MSLRGHRYRCQVDLLQTNVIEIIIRTTPALPPPHNTSSKNGALRISIMAPFSFFSTVSYDVCCCSHGAQAQIRDYVRGTDDDEEEERRRGTWKRPRGWNKWIRRRTRHRDRGSLSILRCVQDEGQQTPKTAGKCEERRARGDQSRQTEERMLRSACGREERAAALSPGHETTLPATEKTRHG